MNTAVKNIPFNSEPVSASQAFKKYYTFGTKLCTSEKFKFKI